MYGELYQYLVLFKQLNIPGIGTFMIERKPAGIDFASKTIQPPSYSVGLYHNNAVPSRKIFPWLADVLQITEDDARNKFQEFSYGIKDRLMSGDKLQWEGIGTLSKGMSGEIRFDSSLRGMVIGSPVPAIKVIRENQEHVLTVGEKEKTTSEMLEWLKPPAEKKSFWWAAALIIGLVAFVFVGWYFSSRGWKTSSSGNQQKISTEQPSPTYKTIP